MRSSLGLLPGEFAFGGEFELRSAFFGSLVSDEVVPSFIAGRFLFYNNSLFDGHNPAPNADDDAALAVDKSALLPGATGSFANYSSYLRGINGVFVDIRFLPGTPSLEDFEFRVGNSSNIETWSLAPDPVSITVRRGEGVHGSDRITLIWPDEAILKSWLEIQVLPTERTGLVQADRFYFGNAVGESGNSTEDARVDPADVLAARANPRNVFNPAEITDPYDFNRDGRVDPADELIARANQTSVITALRLFTVPGNQPSSGPGSDPGGFALALPRDSFPAANTENPECLECGLSLDGSWIEFRLPLSEGTIGETLTLETAFSVDRPRWQPVSMSAVKRAYKGRTHWYWRVPVDPQDSVRLFRVRSVGSSESK